MNRGSSVGEFVFVPYLPSFNEAPIHESGKLPLRWTLRREIRCFNEAPIHESGKSSLRGKRRLMGVASMRPRFMNRGSILTETP